MEELSPIERQSIIASLDEETAAEALAELDKRLTSQIVETLDPEKAATLRTGRLERTRVAVPGAGWP